jgi:hypothetical protein
VYIVADFCHAVNKGLRQKDVAAVSDVFLREPVENAGYFGRRLQCQIDQTSRQRHHSEV